MPPKKWALLLDADRVRLESLDGTEHEITWAERHERVQFHDHFMLRRAIVVKPRKKKIIFRLEPEAFAAIKAWYGPLTHQDLKVSLKRRFAWVVPLGIVFMLTALPIDELPWEPLSFGLGLALVLTGIMAKVIPHRVFFALESLWFCLLAANSISTLIDDWKWLQFALLLLQMLLAFRGIREFHRFAPDQLAPSDGTELESA